MLSHFGGRRSRPIFASPRGTSLSRAALLASALVACAACRPAGGTLAPTSEGPVPWIDADPLAAAEIPAADAPPARVARLDRLLDLFDAARFADAEPARAAMWGALGGPGGRGPAATRDAETRLLAEALALDALEGLQDDARHFLAGAIGVLSADLGLIARAEDLSIRTAAYRDVAERGHPRAADNARWRLYDHARGCLAGALTAPPERRLEVALHALYVREDSIAAWLDERAAHAAPPWPAPAQLVAALTASRDALAADARWREVLARRERGDQELAAAALADLPASRDGAWDLLRAPAGTGRKDSLAPIVAVDSDAVTVDLGRPQALKGRRGAPELVPAIVAALARDGRGAVLLVAPPRLPSPDLAAILAALRDARAARVELALREPRVSEEAGDVIATLPIELAAPVASALTPAAPVAPTPAPASAAPATPPALAPAPAPPRLRVHLGGRGPRLAIDGAWLPIAATPADLDLLLTRLDFAYPREHVIALTLADDVLYQQLQDLLRSLGGGPRRRFESVVWTPAAAPPPEALSDKITEAAARRLEVRAGLFTATASAGLVPGVALAEGDLRRVELLSQRLPRCLPELEIPVQSLDVVIRFEAGRLAAVAVASPPRKAQPARLTALRACLADEARGFRLREKQDAADLVLRLVSSRAS